MAWHAKATPGRIGECQVELVVQSLGRLDSDLARSRLAVILERGFAKIGLAQIVFHFGLLTRCSSKIKRVTLADSRGLHKTDAFSLLSFQLFSGRRLPA
jgi:hypothetical protein